MRILQLHTRYRQRGGEDHVVDAEAAALRGAGHEVRQEIAENPTGTLQSVGALALSPWNPGAARRISRVVDEFRPDIAHVHNTWFAISPSAIHALKKAGLPIVMTLHNYRLACANALLFRDGAPCELCVGSHPWHAVRYGCYRGSRVQSVPAAATIELHRRLGTWVEKVDTFIALTEFQRDMMIRAGLPESKLVVKPNFVPDPGPRPAPPSASSIVLYVGRLSQEKGVDVLLDAWREADVDGLELMVAGEGPLLDALRNDLPPNVRLLGAVPRERVQELVLAARAGVLPSRWYEGLPLTLLEAFAGGLPVVVSDVGSPAQIVGAALGPGWIFESTNPSSLAQTLQKLSDGSWCDSSGDLSRKAYEANFNISQAADRLLGIYRGHGTTREVDSEGAVGQGPP